ncbi:hypothetical protein Scep_019272 [Stephania cephalantha]|uniref:Uncharacterized protein n=1 Tax=Stephania cephalantha TaxID=152367 RepID=A0AAP0IAW7_9MAGN
MEKKRSEEKWFSSGGAVAVPWCCTHALEWFMQGAEPIKKEKCTQRGQSCGGVVAIHRQRWITYR